MNAALSRLHPRKLPKPVLGAFVLIAIVVTVFAAIEKNYITTELMGGASRTVELPGDYFLLARSSVVKVAGVHVGVVKDVERGPNGTALAHVKVSDQAVETVGSAPSARVRPTTLLGGVLYIEIVPGGDRNAPWVDPIPVSRSRLPVELGDVAESFQPDAVRGTSAAINRFDATFHRDGTAAIRDLVDTAPAALGPGARVFTSLRGDRPQVDLPSLVTNAEQMASVLTRKEDQLSSILAGLRTTSTTFADSSGPISTAISRMPTTFDAARSGLAELDTSLEELRRTAGPARPAVRQLKSVMDDLEPMLDRAEPVVRDLRGGLRQLRPTVETLIPVADRADDTFDNLRGPVLDRINGPFKHAVMSPFRGTGIYSHTAGENRFFEEAGYMLVNLNRAGAYADANGHALAFQPGLGPGSLAGPLTVQNTVQEQLFPGGGNG